ncbi:MAG: UPF0236 family transposase-like protein [Opitutaceae bacterium]
MRRTGVSFGWLSRDCPGKEPAPETGRKSGCLRRKVFGVDADYLIDYYHLLEYLCAAATTIAPSKEKNWKRTQKRRLRKGQYKKVIATLKKALEPESQSDEDAPVRRAWRYMTNRPNAFNYHLALEKELPIGSGMIESSHGHILQSRMKKNGMAWTKENAEPMVQLRTLRANNQWEQYWEQRYVA